MTTPRQFMQTLQALAELKVDLVPLPTQPEPVPSTLNHLLANLGPLPREALFLGMAHDGLPVLLNLHDPIPGPVLVTGDAGTGKTLLLQTIAHAITQTHAPSEVQFVVITSHAEEWQALNGSSHQVGLFSAQESAASELLLSLANWAHANKSAQSVVLLVDDFEVAAKMDAETLNHLRWLLLRGPARRVWPVVTLHAARYGQVLGWLPLFRTRIFGRIQQVRVADVLGGEASAWEQPAAARQFSLRENGGWLRFWVPAEG